MRILHCISSLSGGGAERQLSYLAPSLAENGVENHIVYLVEGPAPPNFSGSGVITHRIQHSGNYDILILIRLRKLINMIKPDIVHSWIVQMGVFAGLATRMKGIKWIIREASNAEGAAARRSKQKLLEYMSVWFAHLVANSRGGYDYWQKIRPTLPRSIIVNGIPDDYFSNAERFQTLAPREKHEILFIGRLIPIKNIILLIEAFSALCLHQNSQISLKICGDGALKDHVHNRIADLGLQDCVHEMGYLPDNKIKPLMQKASLMVNPSHYEGCPNAVLEAMALGCPVIVSDIPSHRDILDEKSALFFAPDDKKSLTKVLEKALVYYENTLKRALVARKKAENYSIRKMTNQYLSLYYSLMEDR